MKIIILITSALLSFCTTALAQTKTLQADIRGNFCAVGSGLCFTNMSTTKIQNMKNFNITKLNSNSMVIELQTNKLSIDDQKMFFGKEYSKIGANEELVFIQEKDFVFDPNTLRYLELDPTFCLLKRGSYPLEIVGDLVKVTMNLSQL